MAIAEETDSIKAQFESGASKSKANAIAAEKRKTAFEKMDVQIVTQDKNLLYKADENIQSNAHNIQKPADPINLPAQGFRVSSVDRFGGMKPFQHHSEHIDDFIHDEQRRQPMSYGVQYVPTKPVVLSPVQK